MRILIDRSTHPNQLISVPFTLFLIFALLVLPLTPLRIAGQSDGSGEEETRAAAAEVSRPDIDGSKTEDVLEDEPEFNSPEVIDGTAYPFSAATGIPLEDMSTGTVQIIGPGVDDTASAVQDIGFDFWFDGVRHTQWSCNANGLCRLGSVIVTTTFTNSLATTTASPKIAPFWDDLCVGQDGKVHYKVVGSAPNRKLVVEWFNMKVTRNGTCTGAVGNGTFQMWLHETTGKIQFVYGALPMTATADAGYSVGMQSGVATNIASVTTNGATVSYTTANNAQTDAIPAGTSYIFSPNVPTAPTNLTFAPVTPTSIQLNWVDNSSNEVGFAIFRSTDGANYNFLTLTAANATSFNDTQLLPSTMYSYRVFAVSEGAVSSALAGSQTTTTPVTVTAVAAGGNWSSPATWVGGMVPTADNSVVIPTGATVTIDTDATVVNLSVGNPVSIADRPEGVGGILQFEETTARTLTVAVDAAITPSSTFRSGTTGTQTGHTLTVGRNLTNSGTLDFSTSANTAGAGITFNSPYNGVFGGTGGITDVRTVTVNKGTSSATSIELNPTNFTVQGANADSATAGYLTLTNGTFKVSGSFTVDFRTFSGAAAYTIPATAGFWLNNPNYSVTGQNGSPTNNGLLRVSQGTFNVGTSLGNSMGGGTGATFQIDGGTLNAAGRLQTTSAVNYTQTGGVVNVCTVGQNATTACFGLTSTATQFNMTGGVINLVQINSNATATSRRDYQMGGVAIITGGVLNVGTAATTGNAGDFEFRITGSAPATVIDNTTNPKILSLAGTTFFLRNITINPGCTLNLHNGTTAQTLQFIGSQIINNGTINGGVAAASRLNFLGTDGAGGGTQSYGGSGIWGTMATPTSGFGILGQTTINSPIITNRVNLFGGQMINSNQITLGGGGATATVVQISQAGSLVNGGTFDVAPIFNTGTGGHTLLYLVQPSLRTTGFEVPPSRNILAMTVDAANHVTVAGGDLTVTGTLTMTNGEVRTGANTLIHNGTVARTNGFVVGSLKRSYTATGAYTYHVGENGYSPVPVTITALGTNPSALTVKAVDMPPAGLDPTKSISRFWTLTEEGDLTATLSFTYLAADVNGTEADYRVFRQMTNLCPAGPCVDVATHTGGPVTGVTDFSNWSVAEAGAVAAVPVTVSGRVTSTTGRPIARALVTMTLPGGANRTAVTNIFGFFTFDNVSTGQTVTVAPARKGFTIPSQMVVINSATTINFVGTPSP